MLQQKKLRTTHCSHCISVQLQVKSHASFRLMVGYMNAESSLSFTLWNAAVSRARCQSEGEHTLFRGSHQLCSDLGLSSEAGEGGVTTDKNKDALSRGRKTNLEIQPTHGWVCPLRLYSMGSQKHLFLLLQGCLKHSLNNSFCSLSQH